MGKSIESEDRENLWKRVLSSASPVRWAVLALFVSISLFLFEIAFSFYQVYLSLVGGGVVVTVLTETISFVMFVFFGLAGLAILGLTLWVSLYWLRRETNDDTSVMVRELRDKHIPRLESDIAKIKTKLGIVDKDEEE